MTARLIDGKAVAAKVRKQVAAGVAEIVGRCGSAPGLATILVGEDPASEVYVRNKRRACVATGMVDLHRRLPFSVTQRELEAVLAALAEDPQVSGILLQLPLPDHLDVDALLDLIPPEKDVDGLTAANAGRLGQGRPRLRPCTPAGIERLLDEYEVPLSGAKAVVIGRSVLVGRPMAQLLVARDATVVLCHSRTRDMVVEARQADVLVVAAGVPGLIGREAVRPGATVIDVGIHRDGDGLRGDVQFSQVREVAGLLTPVPGGVGPMTIAMLLENTLQAARQQRNR